jgi:hypothetical protein
MMRHIRGVAAKLSQKSGGRMILTTMSQFQENFDAGDAWHESGSARKCDELVLH